MPVETAQRSLLLVGAGGFGREVAQAVMALNEVRQRWEITGFLDDSAELAGTDVGGISVVGGTEAISLFPDAAVVVCTGSPDNYFSRKRLVNHLRLSEERYATLVHPHASIAHSTTIGRGTAILGSAVTTAAVKIGEHVAIMPGVVMTHDNVIGDFATLASGVRLGGRVTVGEGAYLGAGCLVRQDVKVGPWALVGMGAVVLDDVGPGEVWVGVPARRLRTINVPGDVA